MKKIFFYDFPIGTLGIAEEKNAVSRIFFGKNEQFGYTVAETSLIKIAADQLKEYFDGKRTEFDLPLHLSGTDFQILVWKELQTIPKGETRSYKDVAVAIGKPKACRAVGMANNRNPLAIIVPCHRVIGHNGKLTGYAGGLEIKEFLLNLEKTK